MTETVAAEVGDFYPRSPCGERRWLRCWQLAARDISIHALLAESDDTSGATHRILRAFLSTLSLRRATSIPGGGHISQTHFYPRSPCGERRVHYDNYNLHCVISIHALLAESDLPTAGLFFFVGHFYPRSPCGERRYIGGNAPNFTGISIHALLAESDVIFLFYNSHSKISIHALLAESDRYIGGNAPNFAGISIHALLAESDPSTLNQSHACSISIHALLAESDDNGRIRDAENLTISIHALLAESDTTR